MQQTSLNRAWLLKIGIFALAMIGFGIWALIDAAWLYPARGLADASAKLQVFLASSENAGLLRPDKAATPDPRSTLSTLESRAADLRLAAASATAEGRASQMELDRLAWLEALHRAWKLDAKPKYLGEYNASVGNSTVLKKLTFDPATGVGTLETRAAGAPATTSELPPKALLTELVAYASASPKPTPLSGWDLPMQWSFVALGFGLGGYLLLLIARCAATARKFRYDEAEQRLTLPDGASFTPSEIEDIDKRQWHKFYVTIVTTDGKHHRMDLLRYVPLEDWVLAMEKKRFPERAEEERAEESAAGEEAPANADEAVQ